MSSSISQNTMAYYFIMTNKSINSLIIIFYFIFYQQIIQVFIPQSYNMAFYTTNKPISRHNPSPILINHHQIKTQICQPSQKYQHNSYVPISQRTNSIKQEKVILELIGNKSFIKIIDKAGQNIGKTRKEALMEMTKYRYRKMIQLQNRRLIERNQFQNELEKSKNQIKNRVILQANKIKSDTRERGFSVQNWFKKNSKEGSLIRQQKWLNQAIRKQRDVIQLQKLKEHIQNRNKSMLISRPKKIYSLNKTSYHPSVQYDYPFSVEAIQYPVKKEIDDKYIIPNMSKRVYQSQQSMQKKDQSLGLFYISLKKQQDIQEIAKQFINQQPNFASNGVTRIKNNSISIPKVREEKVQQKGVKISIYSQLNRVSFKESS